METFSELNNPNFIVDLTLVPTQALEDAEHELWVSLSCNVGILFNLKYDNKNHLYHGYLH